MSKKKRVAVVNTALSAFSCSDTVASFDCAFEKFEGPASAARINAIYKRLTLIAPFIADELKKTIHLSYPDFKAHWTSPAGGTWMESYKAIDYTANPFAGRFLSAVNQRVNWEIKMGILPKPTPINATSFSLECLGEVFLLLDIAWQLYHALHVVADIKYLAKIDLTKPISTAEMSDLDELVIDFWAKDLDYTGASLQLSKHLNTHYIVDAPDPSIVNDPYKYKTYITEHTVLNLRTQTARAHNCYTFNYCSASTPEVALSCFVLDGMPDRVLIPCDSLRGVPDVRYRRVNVYRATEAGPVYALDCYVLRLVNINPDSEIGFLVKCMQLAFECSYQYFIKIEKQRVSRERSYAIQQGIKPEPTTPKPRNRFASLIHRYYYGDVAEKSSPKGTHASPCRHDRRGFYRHYKKSGTVGYVNPTVVNPDKPATVYKMNKPKGT